MNYMIINPHERLEPQEPRIVKYCEICDSPIYEEIDYYVIEDCVICEHCIDEFIQEHKIYSS